MRCELTRSDHQPAEPLFRIETHLQESRNLLVIAGQIGLDAAVQLHDQAKHLAANGCDVDVDWREAESVTAGCFRCCWRWDFLCPNRGGRCV